MLLAFSERLAFRIQPRDARGAVMFVAVGDLGWCSFNVAPNFMFALCFSSNYFPLYGFLNLRAVSYLYCGLFAPKTDLTYFLTRLARAMMPSVSL